MIEKPKPKVTGLDILRTLIPVILAIITVWGSSAYFKNEDEKRLVALETQQALNNAAIQQFRQQVDLLLQSNVSKEQFKFFVDTSTQNYDKIDKDIREIRQRQK